MKTIRFHDRYGNERSIDTALLPASKTLLKTCGELQDRIGRLQKLEPEATALVEKAASGGDLEKLTEKLVTIRTAQELSRARIGRLEADACSAVVEVVREAFKQASADLEKATAELRTAKEDSKAVLTEEYGKRGAERLPMYGFKKKSVREGEKAKTTARENHAALEALLLQTDREAWSAAMRGFSPGILDKVQAPDFAANCASVLRQLAA